MTGVALQAGGDSWVGWANKQKHARGKIVELKLVLLALDSISSGWTGASIPRPSGNLVLWACQIGGLLIEPRSINPSSPPVAGAISLASHPFEQERNQFLLLLRFNQRACFHFRFLAPGTLLR